MITRPRSNALQTGRTIEVEGLKVGDFRNFDRGAKYYPIPNNTNFLAAFIGNKREGHPLKGWKLHISAYPYNAQLVAEKVLPILCELEIWHKYVKSPMLLSQMPDAQRGKFITVYTKDTELLLLGVETRKVIHHIKEKRAISGDHGPQIIGETRLSEDFMIFGRYSYDYTKPGE